MGEVLVQSKNRTRCRRYYAQHREEILQKARELRRLGKGPVRKPRTPEQMRLQRDNARAKYHLRKEAMRQRARDSYWSNPAAARLRQKEFNRNYPLKASATRRRAYAKMRNKPGFRENRIEHARSLYWRPRPGICLVCRRGFVGSQGKQTCGLVCHNKFRRDKSLRIVKASGKTSTLERLVTTALEEQGIASERQRLYEVGGWALFLLDIALVQFKVVVECHGSYWHYERGTPYAEVPPTVTQKRTMRNDTLRREYFSNSDWVLVELWETEIRKDLPGCIRRVKDAIARQSAKLLGVT